MVAQYSSTLGCRTLQLCSVLLFEVLATAPRSRFLFGFSALDDNEVFEANSPNRRLNVCRDAKQQVLLHLLASLGLPAQSSSIEAGLCLQQVLASVFWAWHGWKPKIRLGTSLH